MLTSTFRISAIILRFSGLVIWACALAALGGLAQSAPKQDTSAPRTAIPGPVMPADTSQNADAKKSNGWPLALGLLSSREITIDSPRLTINLPDKGGVASITVTSGQALTPLLTMVKKLAFKKIHLKDGTFVFRTPHGFTQTIYSVDAIITGDRNSSIRSASGRFKFRGEELSFEISSINPSGKSKIAGVPISFRLYGDKLKAQLAGTINVTEGFGVEGKLQISLPDVKFFSAWLGYPLSDRRETLELKADGAFSWKGSVFSFIDGQFVMGGSQAKGAISADLTGARARVDGTIAFENIDLSNLLPGIGSISGDVKKTTDGGEIALAARGGLNGIDNLDLGYFNEFDADFRLSAESVNLGSITAQDCAVTVTLKSGDLIVGLVESKIAGGMVHGEIDLKKRNKKNHAYLRADLENIAIEKFTEALKLASPLKGLAHIKLDLGGHGANIAEITKTVSGELRLTMNQEVELTLARDIFKVQTEDKEALEWWMKTLSGSNFAIMKNVLKFDQGQAVSRSFIMQAEKFDVIGMGTVNLADRKIALRLRRVSVINDLTEGSAGFKDKSTDQILIHGSWSKPYIVPQKGSDMLDFKQDGIGPKRSGTRDADRGEKAGIMPDRG